MERNLCSEEQGHRQNLLSLANRISIAEQQTKRLPSISLSDVATWILPSYHTRYIAKKITTRHRTWMWLVIACTMPVMIASGVVTISIHYYQSLSQSNAQNVLLPAVAWANDNWNCANIACTSTVQAGQPQPNYGCAEFVARALATEGFMPGLTSSSPQKSYDPYRPAGSKKDYDLLLIGHRTGLHTLADYLLDYGYAKNIGMDLREAKAGDAVVFSDLIYDKPAEEHVVLITTPGASPSSVKVAAHNNARYDNPLSNEINGFNGGWYILHIVYSNTSQL